MASIAHVAIGMAAGRLAHNLLKGREVEIGGPLRWMAAFAGLSMLPDADVIAFLFGIPYEAPFGHRGASHSIAFALGMGALAGLWGKLRLGHGLALAIVAGVTVLSHPLLDAMTDGGFGVALYWPWDTERIFFGWRPIPVAPIGGAFFSPRGLKVAMAEFLPSLPFLIYGLWPRRA